MINEKAIKDYANNYNLIDKAGVMLCFAFFCWAESHFKTNVIFACHGIILNLKNFQTKWYQQYCSIMRQNKL